MEGREKERESELERMKKSKVEREGERAQLKKQRDKVRKERSYLSIPGWTTQTHSCPTKSID